MAVVVSEVSLDFVREEDGFEIFKAMEDGIEIWPVFPVGGQVSEFTATCLSEALQWCEQHRWDPGPELS